MKELATTGQPTERNADQDPNRFAKRLGHSSGSQGFEGMGPAFSYITGETNPDKRKVFIESFAEAAAAVTLRIGTRVPGPSVIDGVRLDSDDAVNKSTYTQLTLEIRDFLMRVHSIIFPETPSEEVSLFLKKIED